MNRARSSQSGSNSVRLNPIDIPLSDHSNRKNDPKIIVLHDTEGHNERGTSDLYTLKDVLANQGLSVHIGNDAEGNCARYVSDNNYAFHCAAFNEQSLGIEQIGFASQSSWPSKQIDNTAQWIAYWTQKYNIPITRSTTHGICTHADLGVAGGNHSDPGPNYPFARVLQKAADYADTVVVGGGAAPGGATNNQTNVLDESTAKAAAFATYFNIEGLFDTFRSLQLKGDKSLMNDKPLFPLIQQLCGASLRRFQSMPNGNFFAFYPDYFGGAEHRQPYWEISDMEIIDGQIELNDDNLATHVFVVGDTIGNYDGIDIIDMDNTAGVINMFNAFQANFITGFSDQERPESLINTNPKKGKDPTETKQINTRLMSHDDVVTFLKKYGARPYYEEASMVRSPFYEAFLAFQRFCLLWSQQFATTFSLTFMPELFPGGLIAMPQHGIQLFVEEVEHTFDFETGFTTQVTFSSPAALGHKGKEHEGMIRAGVLDTT